MTTQEVLKEDLLTLEPKAFYLKHIVNTLSSRIIGISLSIFMYHRMKS